MSFAHRLDGGPTSARCGEVSARRHSPTCRSTNLLQAGRCHSSYPDFCAGVMELLACGKPLFQYFYVGDPYERASKACGLLRDVATCKYLSCKYKNKYWCCLTAQVLIGCKYKQYVIIRQQNRTLNSFEENWLEQSLLHVLWISTTECCKKRPNGSRNHMLRHRNACLCPRGQGFTSCVYKIRDDSFLSDILAQWSRNMTPPCEKTLYTGHLKPGCSNHAFLANIICSTTSRW